MLDPIRELNEICNSYVPTNMLAMEPKDFEKYFGRIHAALSLFSTLPKTDSQTQTVVQVVCQLLERAIENHKTEFRTVTPITVKIYDDIVSILDRLLAVDLKINQHVYNDALNVSRSLAAIKACNIAPLGYNMPSYTSRFPAKQQDESEHEDLLQYARENIKEFTNFVFNLASSGAYIPDPFQHGSDSASLILYKRVSYLHSGLVMISRRDN